MTCRPNMIYNREERKKNYNIRKIRNRKPVSYCVKMINVQSIGLWEKIKNFIWGNNYGCLFINNN